jgi:hypothetical protein
MTLHDDGRVTVSGFRSEVGAHQAAATAVQAAMPGTEVVDDPWAGMPATQQWQQPQQQAQPNQWQQPTQAMQPPTQVQAQPQQQAPTRFCAHGQMKYFANGQYGPFFACSLDRNDPNKCKTQKA